MDVEPQEHGVEGNEADAFWSAPSSSSSSSAAFSHLSNVLRGAHFCDAFVAGGVVDKALCSIPRVAVQGLGQLKFPLATEQLSSLLKCGKKLSTDSTVTAIDACQLQLDVHWLVQQLPQLVESACVQLGMADRANGRNSIAAVDARLRKLLLCQVGPFGPQDNNIFSRCSSDETVPGAVAGGGAGAEAMEIDMEGSSERECFGTLLLQLPTSFAGGDLLVSHRGRKTQLSSGGSACSSASKRDPLHPEMRFTAFYAQVTCLREPITAGCRLVLAFDLFIDRAKLCSTGLPFTIPVPEDLTRLRAALQKAALPLNLPTAPQKLLVRLQGKFSRDTLSFSGLTGVDKARVDLLRTATTATPGEEGESEGEGEGGEPLFAVFLVLMGRVVTGQAAGDDGDEIAAARESAKEDIRERNAEREERRETLEDKSSRRYQQEDYYSCHRRGISDEEFSSDEEISEDEMTDDGNVIDDVIDFDELKLNASDVYFPEKGSGDSPSEHDEEKSKHDLSVVVSALKWVGPDGGSCGLDAVQVDLATEFVSVDGGAAGAVAPIIEAFGGAGAVPDEMDYEGYQVDDDQPGELTHVYYSSFAVLWPFWRAKKKLASLCPASESSTSTTAAADAMQCMSEAAAVTVVLYAVENEVAPKRSSVQRALLLDYVSARLFSAAAEEDAGASAISAIERILSPSCALRLCLTGEQCCRVLSLVGSISEDSLAAVADAVAKFGWATVGPSISRTVEQLCKRAQSLSAAAGFMREALLRGLQWAEPLRDSAVDAVATDAQAVQALSRCDVAEKLFGIVRLFAPLFVAIAGEHENRPSYRDFLPLSRLLTKLTSLPLLCDLCRLSSEARLGTGIGNTVQDAVLTLTKIKLCNGELCADDISAAMRYALRVGGRFGGALKLLLEVDLLAASIKDCPAGRLLALDAVVRDAAIAHAIGSGDEALREVLLHYLRCLNGSRDSLPAQIGSQASALLYVVRLLAADLGRHCDALESVAGSLIDAPSECSAEVFLHQDVAELMRQGTSAGLAFRQQLMAMLKLKAARQQLQVVEALHALDVCTESGPVQTRGDAAYYIEQISQALISNGVDSKTTRAVLRGPLASRLMTRDGAGGGCAAPLKALLLPSLQSKAGVTQKLRSRDVVAALCLFQQHGGFEDLESIASVAAVLTENRHHACRLEVLRDPTVLAMIRQGNEALRALLLPSLSFTVQAEAQKLDAADVLTAVDIFSAGNRIDHESLAEMVRILCEYSPTSVAYVNSTPAAARTPAWLKAFVPRALALSAIVRTAAAKKDPLTAVAVVAALRLFQQHGGFEDLESIASVAAVLTENRHHACRLEVLRDPTVLAMIRQGNEALRALLLPSLSFTVQTEAQKLDAVDVATAIDIFSAGNRIDHESLAEVVRILCEYSPTSVAYVNSTPAAARTPAWLKAFVPRALAMRAFVAAAEKGKLEAKGQLKAKDVVAALRLFQQHGGFEDLESIAYVTRELADNRHHACKVEVLRDPTVLAMIRQGNKALRALLLQSLYRNHNSVLDAADVLTAIDIFSAGMRIDHKSLAEVARILCEYSPTSVAYVNSTPAAARTPAWLKAFVPRALAVPALVRAAATAKAATDMRSADFTKAIGCFLDGAAESLPPLDAIAAIVSSKEPATWVLEVLRHANTVAVLRRGHVGFRALLLETLKAATSAVPGTSKLKSSDVEPAVVTLAIDLFAADGSEAFDVLASIVKTLFASWPAPSVSAVLSHPAAIAVVKKGHAEFVALFIGALKNVQNVSVEQVLVAIELVAASNGSAAASLSVSVPEIVGMITARGLASALTTTVMNDKRTLQLMRQGSGAPLRALQLQRLRAGVVGVREVLDFFHFVMDCNDAAWLQSLSDTLVSPAPGLQAASASVQASSVKGLARAVLSDDRVRDVIRLQPTETGGAAGEGEVAAVLRSMLAAAIEKGGFPQAATAADCVLALLSLLRIRALPALGQLSLAMANFSGTVLSEVLQNAEIIAAVRRGVQPLRDLCQVRLRSLPTGVTTSFAAPGALHSDPAIQAFLRGPDQRYTTAPGKFKSIPQAREYARTLYTTDSSTFKVDIVPSGSGSRALCTLTKNAPFYQEVACRTERQRLASFLVLNQPGAPGVGGAGVSTAAGASGGGGGGGGAKVPAFVPLPFPTAASASSSSSSSSSSSGHKRARDPSPPPKVAPKAASAPKQSSKQPASQTIQKLKPAPKAAPAATAAPGNKTKVAAPKKSVEIVDLT